MSNSELTYVETVIIGHVIYGFNNDNHPAMYAEWKRCVEAHKAHYGAQSKQHQAIMQDVEHQSKIAR